MRKRLLFIFLLGLILIPYTTYAEENEYYINHNGVEIERNLYNELCDIYSIGYVEFLTHEEFENLTENGLSNVTKETYIEGNSFSKGPYYSTGSKSVSLVKNGSYITLLGSWIVVPNTKSYDVIAVRLSGVSLDGSYSFKQSYVYGGNYNVIYNGNNQNFSNGFGSSAKLQNGTNQEYSLTFKVSGSGTVYGSYQHAVTQVTLNQSKNYTISSSGFGSVINFASSVSKYYDGMNGTDLSV